jgi:hypothetical protein
MVEGTDYGLHEARSPHVPARPSEYPSVTRTRHPLKQATTVSLSPSLLLSLNPHHSPSSVADSLFYGTPQLLVLTQAHSRIQTWANLTLNGLKRGWNNVSLHATRHPKEHYFSTVPRLRPLTPMVRAAHWQGNTDVLGETCTSVTGFYRRTWGFLRQINFITLHETELFGAMIPGYPRELI